MEEFRGTERFAIRRRLGAGGMGVVYEAIDRQDNQSVALKTLRDMDAGSILRLKEEFRSLADLTHPNLVALHELVAEQDQWFFTMELVDGKDFLSYVRTDIDLTSADTATFCPSQGDDDPTRRSNWPPPVGPKTPAQPLPPRQYTRLRETIRQLAEGLLMLHTSGMLHRDIKPSNVLVTRNGRVVLLDFGLAVAKDHQLHKDAKPRTPVGTVGYMAPEQARGLSLTEAGDWYSVGVMLYAALVGRLPEYSYPLRGADADAAPSIAPRDHCPDVPDDLNLICCRLLEDDPQRRMGGAELLRRLGSLPPQPEVAPSWKGRRDAPFVGRERQLDQLAEAYATMCRDRCAVVVELHGLSGHGKSSLVERFLERIRDPDTVILAGRCYERESVPYKGLDNLIDSLCQYLLGLSPMEVEAILPRNVHFVARLFPVLNQVTPIATAVQRAPDTPDRQQLRQRGFAALREMFDRLGERGPLVLAIDDMQWGDADSAALLAHLIGPPEPPPLLLLTAYRSEEAGRFPFRSVFDRLAQGKSGELVQQEVTVGALSWQESRDLALQLLRRRDDEAIRLAETVARESDGNPYFVGEFLLYLRGGSSTDRPASTQLTLERVLSRRIGKLPDPQRRLLEVIAVAGRPLSRRLACESARLTTDQQTVMRALTASHLLRASGPDLDDTLVAYHDRIRETIVSELSAGTLLDRHDALAQAMETTGRADPEALALHLLGANHRERAGVFFARAADRAAEALAFDRAAVLYRRALELPAPDDETPRRLRARLGDALANAGRGAEAAAEYHMAAAGALAAEQLELQRRAAVQSLISGHIDEGLAALRRVLDQVGLRLAPTPTRALVSLLYRRGRLRLRGLGFQTRDASQVSAETLTRIDICWSAAVGLSIVDTIRGADFQTRNLLLALDAGEPYRIARALAWEAAHVANTGATAARRTERLLDAAEQLARRIDHPHAHGLVKLSRGIASYMIGRWPAARELTAAADQIFRDQCTGVTWEVDTALSFHLWSLFFLGQVGQLRDQLPQLIKEAGERGDLYATTNWGTFVGYLTWLADDDADGAREDLRRVMQQWSVGGFHVQHLTGLMAHIQIDLYRGAGQAAWQRVEHDWPRVRESFFLRVQVVRIFLRYLRARAALAAARDNRSPRLLRIATTEIRRLRREHGADWSRPLIDMLQAGLAQCRGAEQQVLPSLQRAAHGFEAAQMRLFAAATRRRIGELQHDESTVQAADQWMSQQQIKNPAAMTNQHVP